MNNIKTYNNFIKETKNYPYVHGILDKNDIDLVISREELDDQFLRLKEVLHCSYNIVYYTIRSPNTQNDKTYYYVKFDKIIRVETNEYNEILQIKKKNGAYVSIYSRI